MSSLPAENATGRLAVASDHYNPGRRRFPVPAAIAVIIGALLFIVLTDGGRHANTPQHVGDGADRILRHIGLGLDTIWLNGNRRTSPSEIFAALALDSDRILFGFDSQKARERVAKLPWVDKVEISRTVPNTVEVTITEREPYALWQHGNDWMVVDRTGRTLSLVKRSTYKTLPRVSGAGAGAQAPVLFAMLKQFPSIMKRFEHAERIGARRWAVKLLKGPLIQLPEDNASKVLAAFLSRQDSQNLLSGSFATIDLRTPEAVIVRKGKA